MMEDCVRVEEAKQIDETQSVLAEIADAAARLEEFVDRVIGSEPSQNVAAAANAGLSASARPPVMTSLRMATKAGSHSLGRIRRAMARLEEQI